jgi:hypothetical protein
MPTLQIPKKFESGLAELLTLPDEIISEIIQAIEHAPLVSRHGDLVEAVSKGVKNSPKETLDQIISVLTSLSLIRSNANLSIKKIATDVTESMQKSSSDVLQSTEEGYERFKLRLEKLLSSKALYITAKAKEISQEYEHTFCSARVLTDLRPIFSEEVGETPIAGVVIHNLKLVHHSEEEHKEFYVALDSEDIASLIQSLQRAQEKAKSLDLLFKSANLLQIN